MEKENTQSALPIPAPVAAPSAPPHTQTQSTLAPTAEFTRIFLLAWIIRYVFRGFSGAAFEERLAQPGLRAKILNAFSVPGRALQKALGGPEKISLGDLEAATYATTIGLGSGWLSWRYSNMVKADIQNIFSETVAYEKGSTPAEVTFDDIKKSDNAIIQRTVANYRGKFWERIGTDALFLLSAPLRSGHVTDFLLGVKGVQIFADTWKRKTTMFEDLISFINNKINPRNGLGQPIGIGEVFDLYQHYCEAFQPDRMFRNVVERGTGEGSRWAASQPIFQRMTELMNETYAYKHRAVIDPQTGHAVHQADFALPKFIYLLGHNLIDVNKPEQTLATIEIANRYGMEAVKDVSTQLAQNVPLAQAIARYPFPKAPTAEKQSESSKNGVIAKGSTMQLDAAPSLKIDAATALHHAPLGVDVNHAIA